MSSRRLKATRVASTLFGVSVLCPVLKLGSHNPSKKKFTPRISSESVGRLQNLLELLLLIESQGCGELDTVLNNEVAPLSGLLGDGHA